MTELLGTLVAAAQQITSNDLLTLRDEIVAARRPDRDQQDPAALMRELPAIDEPTATAYVRGQQDKWWSLWCGALPTRDLLLDTTGIDGWHDNAWPTDDWDDACCYAMHLPEILSLTLIQAPARLREVIAVLDARITDRVDRHHPAYGMFRDALAETLGRRGDALATLDAARAVAT